MGTDATGSQWEPQPTGANWLARTLDRFRSLNPDVAPFEKLLREETGTRLSDWVDHVCVTSEDGLSDAGYQSETDGWWSHPAALLPAVHVTSFERLLLRVDSVSDFAAANSQRFRLTIEGRPLDRRRIGVIDNRATARLGVIERHGTSAQGQIPDLSDTDRIELGLARERLRHRPRRFGTDDDAFEFTESLLRYEIESVGRDEACDLFFQGERVYWLSRNRAGRIQLMRQNALGMGLGNHDHHTYRSSRANFSRLIRLLEMLGFACRERFYAGAEAGWGAQVLEHPVCGIVIFADVDLGPDEVSDDFAHQPLPPQETPGTIGLWCALHGEALFEAGLHHLECQFDFDAARSQLAALGINCMAPFTDFPYLRQCFTEGERWAVPPGRIRQALQQGWITQDQADRFAAEGVLGSHLEILERNDGYRGFNQQGINEIIRKTDPRTLSAESETENRRG